MFRWRNLIIFPDFFGTTNEHKELRIYIFSAIEVTDVTEISRITCAAGNTIGSAVADTAMCSNKKCHCEERSDAEIFHQLTQVIRHKKAQKVFTTKKRSLSAEAETRRF